ncbi:methyltransferase [Granulosicoccus antarcticus]|uniref:Ribosomal RNA large subunit methyltransferase G n=1 Tax=Granulosicoccus antarcticus IMCC3135 TaxID=1192854 RepID=A0A2Z2NZU9_9GAMM|nr:methyltransferase [Granulosicoccus antarcticus]ASJ72654.1 Ribosomal RNA large subunit methyltransferase G [Granulosicoccus antarcticus IMCC3135]
MPGPCDGFRLHRWPRVQNDPLQAWDAADEFVLQHVATLELPQSPRVLLINDSYGALATCLHHYSPVSWSDSSLSHRAAAENLLNNDIDTPLRALPSTEAPQGMFDLVLIRVPKTTALLEDQLARLRPHVHAGTIIVAGAMIKHLQKSAFACFEQYLGPVTTSLGVKKARLIFATIDETLAAPESPYPTQFHDAEMQIALFNHANVFSRDHLDHGARFLLSQYDQLPRVDDAIDLGCGNGVLGIRLQQRQPEAKVQFIDESYSAVASAILNYQTLIPGESSELESGVGSETESGSAPSFVVADSLEHRAAESTKLVLCNPPFHQQHVLGDRIAQAMFLDSKRCLEQGGELWVVSNRHLDYGSSLQRLFGHCRTVASNKKFVVFRAVKR